MSAVEHKTVTSREHENNIVLSDCRGIVEALVPHYGFGTIRLAQQGVVRGDAVTISERHLPADCTLAFLLEGMVVLFSGIVNSEQTLHALSIYPLALHSVRSRASVEDAPLASPRALIRQMPAAITSAINNRSGKIDITVVAGLSGEVIETFNMDPHQTVEALKIKVAIGRGVPACCIALAYQNWLCLPDALPLSQVCLCNGSHVSLVFESSLRLWPFDFHEFLSPFCAKYWSRLCALTANRHAWRGSNVALIGSSTTHLGAPQLPAAEEVWNVDEQDVSITILKWQFGDIDRWVGQLLLDVVLYAHFQYTELPRAKNASDWVFALLQDVNRSCIGSDDFPRLIPPIALPHLPSHLSLILPPSDFACEIPSMLVVLNEGEISDSDADLSAVTCLSMSGGELWLYDIRDVRPTDASWDSTDFSF